MAQQRDRSRCTPHVQDRSGDQVGICTPEPRRAHQVRAWPVAGSAWISSTSGGASEFPASRYSPSM